MNAADRFSRALGDGRGSGRVDDTGALICVLDDEATWTGLDGCRVVEIAADDDFDIVNATDVCAFTPQPPYADIGDGPEPHAGGVYALVLNDGQTWSPLPGCTVAHLNDLDYDGERVLSRCVVLRRFFYT